MRNKWKPKAIPVLMLLCLVLWAMPPAEAAGTQSGRDYSELQEQIGMANSMDSYDYTKESWEVLQKAVEDGNAHLSGEYSQSELNAAAEEIAYAIENLVKMDYSALIDALDLVYAKIDESPEEHDVWYRLDKAVDKARPLLVSGDQEAVDAMAATLGELMKELAACDDTPVEPEVVIREIKVEVPPSSDFCNIPTHRIWPVLFAASGALNILLLAILGFVLFRRHKTTDNTPLVNYDIEEDIDF